MTVEASVDTSRAKTTDGHERKQVRIAFPRAQKAHADGLAHQVLWLERNELHLVTEHAAHAARQERITDPAAHEVHQRKDIADSHGHVRREARDTKRLQKAAIRDEPLAQRKECLVAAVVQI